MRFQHSSRKLIRMKKGLFLFICFIAAQVSFAQPPDKAKMERERQELQNELKEIQAAYNKVKGQQKATIGQVAILSDKMKTQTRYIGNISQEIKILSDDILIVEMY